MTRQESKSNRNHNDICTESERKRWCLVLTHTHYWQGIYKWQVIQRALRSPIIIWAILIAFMSARVLLSLSRSALLFCIYYVSANEKSYESKQKSFCFENGNRCKSLDGGVERTFHRSYIHNTSCTRANITIPRHSSHSLVAQFCVYLSLFCGGFIYFLSRIANSHAYSGRRLI